MLITFLERNNKWVKIGIKHGGREGCTLTKKNLISKKLRK